MIIMGHIISLGVMRGNCHNSHQRKFSKRESSGSGKHYETEKSFSTLPSAHQRRQFQFQFGKLQTKHMVRKYDTTQTCEGNLYVQWGKGCQAILNITFLLLKVHWRTICRVKSRPPRDWGWHVSEREDNKRKILIHTIRKDKDSS